MPEEKLELNVSSSGVGEATKNMDLLANSIGSVNRLMAGLGITMGGLAIGSFFKSAVNEAVKYEEQIAQIQKVTDRGVAKQMRVEIQDMAAEMPIARDEMTQIVEEAGRLGVEGVDNIKGFTETISQLSVATNIASRDAAKDFARFASLTQTPIEQVEELGSVVNKLSNNMATSASEIVDSMTRAGGAASQFGIQAENISAITASLNEVSASARRSGTRIRRVFQELQNPKKVEDVARALNMTVTEFERMQKNSPEELFISLVRKFRTSEKAADQMRQTFGSASRTAIAGLSQNIEGLRDSLGMAEGQMENATSLTREYGIQAATTASEQQILANRVQNLETQLGDDLMPTYRELLDFSSRLARGFSIIAFNADEVSNSIRNMQRVIGAGEGINKMFEGLTVDAPVLKMFDLGWVSRRLGKIGKQMNKFLGKEVNVSNFLSKDQMSSLKNKFAGVFQQAVKENPQIANNFVDAFKSRFEKIKGSLMEGQIDSKEAIKQFRSFYDTWRTRIAHATSEGAGDGADTAAKKLSESRQRILKGSAEFLERRLARDSAKMANKFKSQFETKFQSIKKRIESGSIDPNLGVQKMNDFFDKWRKKISTATQNGVEDGADSAKVEPFHDPFRGENNIDYRPFGGQMDKSLGVQPFKDPFAKSSSTGRTPTDGYLDMDAPFRQMDKKMQDSAENGAKQLSRTAQSLQYDFSNSLATGIQNGFDQGEDTFNSFLQDISGTLSRSLAQDITKGLTGQITGGSGSGGSGINWTSLISSVGGGLYSGGAAVGNYAASFFDTPGVMEAQDGSVVKFARGDKFAAAQNYGDLQNQVNGGGGGGDTININQTVQISPETEQTIKAQIQNALPGLKEATKEAVYDEMNRGGGPSDSVRLAG